MSTEKICENCKHFVRENEWQGVGKCDVPLPPWLYREAVRVGNQVYEKPASTKVYWNETCVFWEAK